MESARVVAWGRQLRRAHERLADALVSARESIESGAPVAVPLPPLTYCSAFCTALDGHHRGEGSMLFPRVLERHPELAEVVDNLSRDHTMIGHLLGDLRQSIDRGDPPDVVLRHLDGVEAVMTTHFRYEEKRLLGVLDGLSWDGVDPTEVFGPLA